MGLEWEPTKYAHAIDEAADGIAMHGHDPSPSRLRAAVNCPWEYPPDGTKVLVLDNSGHIKPQTVWKPKMTSTGLPAVITTHSYVLALAAEGITWVRGWELTPDVARQLRDAANRAWEEE